MHRTDRTALSHFDSIRNALAMLVYLYLSFCLSFNTERLGDSLPGRVCVCISRTVNNAV